MERLTYWDCEWGCWSYRVASGEAAKRLAAYEDTGYTPEEVEALKADNDRLHKLLGEIEEVVIAKPEEPSGKKIVHCRDCDYLNMDNDKPYCCHIHMSTSGLDDWCYYGIKRKENNNA